MNAIIYDDLISQSNSLTDSLRGAVLKWVREKSESASASIELRDEDLIELLCSREVKQNLYD